MKVRNVLVVAGILAIGVSSPMAMAAKDHTNTYFTANTSPTLMLEGDQKPNFAGTMIDRTTISPVLIETSNALPVVIEDRIVKKKHAFKVGIWPLFDFEVL